MIVTICKNFTKVMNIFITLNEHIPQPIELNRTLQNKSNIRIFSKTLSKYLIILNREFSYVLENFIFLGIRFCGYIPRRILDSTNQTLCYNFKMCNCFSKGSWDIPKREFIFWSTKFRHIWLWLLPFYPPLIWSVIETTHKEKVAF